MKRIVLLIGFVVMALCASAQTPVYLDFHEMQPMHVPVAMSGEFPVQSGLMWDNFLAVTPGMWNGAGPGFWVDPVGLHSNVTFLGGPWQSIAVGAIRYQSIKLSPVIPTFQPINMWLSAGWMPNNVVVTAVTATGETKSKIWPLTLKPQEFKFPPEWTNITLLTFTPYPGQSHSIRQLSGSMVIYSFLLVER